MSENRHPERSEGSCRSGEMLRCAQHDTRERLRFIVFAGLFLLAATLVVSCSGGGSNHKAVTEATTHSTMLSTGDFSYPPAPKESTSERVTELNAACIVCHTDGDNPTMHTASVCLACVDCHGGNGEVTLRPDATPDDADYLAAKRAAHVTPKIPALWKSSANPQIPGTQTNRESADYIRFVNPGDLRAARASCGACHEDEVRKVEKSMMAHGAMLWSAALYNNGAINRKIPVFGESYAPDGRPQKLVQNPPPTTQQASERGILAQLFPLPRWEISQPGNILRVFERGGKIRPAIGIPDRLEDAGKPDVKLSLRGYGTDVRTDPVFLGLQKTRLLDPTLNLFGTNDHAGDYRASGCSACHVVYANDRSPIHSGAWANAGNAGRSQSKDPTIPKDEPGHPIQHAFVKNMPTSTCIVCHVHPGTNVVNSYLGFTWWDNETDAKLMYPKEQRYPTPAEEAAVNAHNPEGAAPRGLWSDFDFLSDLWPNINPQLTRTQFADFHGHGWVFRAVFKQDRHGHLLDAAGKTVQDVTAAKLKQSVEYQWTKEGDAPPAGIPVHLKDIHLEKGMHCVDCHFAQDNHGDGNLYGETRNATMVECVDCHGTLDRPAPMLEFFKKKDDKLLSRVFSGKAASSSDSRATRKVLDNHFEDDEGKLIQTSAIDSKVKWTVKQAVSGESTSKAATYAHTVRKDGKTWGVLRANETEVAFAHSSNVMSCYACHTSWNTSCSGCHLPMRANQAKPMLHNEGLLTRNYTNYNFQTLRDDVYQLGKDSSVKGGKVVPIRSACAVMVSSQDANRQWIYAQQQTVSAEGFAGTAFSPYFPHTVRTTETKQCTDCHVSSAGDNNAIMAQLLLQGTNSVGFIGRFAWVGLGEHGLEAVAVTERDEPQAVIGSRLHEFAYPDYFKKHVARKMELSEAHEHSGTVLDLQLRGEYLYAACGKDGFIAYDVANIDNKGFSERIITAPVSPLGQQFYVKTKYATSICSPSTMAIDPTRPRRAENEEGAIHPMYAFLYVTDKYEGLVVIGNPLDEKRNKPGVATLLDGNPSNNFLRRAVTFNPDGRLNGARHMALFGHYAYVSCDSGVVLVDLDDPLHPRLIDTPGLASITGPRKIAFQFRYGFVCDDDGLKVIDVTNPESPRVIDRATLPLADARDIYVSRTYGYVAAGSEGLVIVDLEKPEDPQRVESFTAGGMDDATAVRVGMTNSSLFAYVADGRNGLKVLQLTSADERDDTPTYFGFSPRPRPRLIARFKTHGSAIALSEGLDRDRAVDESGNQLAVFGRKGARPFNLEEQRRLYLKDGKLYTVKNEPTQPAIAVEKPPAPKPPASEPATAPSRRGPPRRRP